MGAVTNSIECIVFHYCSTCIHTHMHNEWYYLVASYTTDMLRSDVYNVTVWMVANDGWRINYKFGCCGPTGIHFRFCCSLFPCLVYADLEVGTEGKLALVACEDGQMCLCDVRCRKMVGTCFTLVPVKGIHYNTLHTYYIYSCNTVECMYILFDWKLHYVLVLFINYSFWYTFYSSFGLFVLIYFLF